MNDKLKTREEVDKSLTWDLSTIYKSEEEALNNLSLLKDMTKEIMINFKGKLTTAQRINDCLDQLRGIQQILTFEWSYAELALSVDYSNTHLQELNNKVHNILDQTNSHLSFIKSEILQQPTDRIEKAANISEENNRFLNDLLREKPHVLSAETEAVLASYSGILDAPYQIYLQTKLADMDFPNFTVHEKQYPLGYALWENVYEYEIDPEIRRTAFREFSRKIKEYEFTTAAAYQTQVQKEKVEASLRGFDSVFDFLLFPQKVDRSMYNRQIDLIMEKLAPHMRKYAKLLKKIHHLDHMTYPDLKISVDPSYDPTVTIEESKKYIENALSILGEDYHNMVKEAYQDRWIDFAQNKGKSTGGFCESPYGTNSFILLSWSEKMAEVFTLAHELGHAGHFKLCNDAQNIFNTDVSVYFVESPSTMNELLMANYLIQTNPDKRFRRWVLASMISNTYYHNFVTHLLEAAHQRKVYEIIDQGGSVSAETLCRLQRDVLTDFWGEDVEISEEAELTWMRQPHYYMGLYSYTYSAGLTIATKVSQRILAKGKPAIDDWRAALSAGSTKTPVELAAMAGVDITTDQPLLDTIEYIGSMIDEIIQLTEEIGE